MLRLATIGHTASLPRDCQRELQEAIEATKGNTGLTLVLALSYRRPLGNSGSYPAACG